MEQQNDDNRDSLIGCHPIHICVALREKSLLSVVTDRHMNQLFCCHLREQVHVSEYPRTFGNQQDWRMMCVSSFSNKNAPTNLSCSVGAYQYLYQAIFQ